MVFLRGQFYNIIQNNIFFPICNAHVTTLVLFKTAPASGLVDFFSTSYFNRKPAIVWPKQRMWLLSVGIKQPFVATIWDMSPTLFADQQKQFVQAVLGIYSSSLPVMQRAGFTYLRSCVIRSHGDQRDRYKWLSPFSNQNFWFSGNAIWDPNLPPPQKK